MKSLLSEGYLKSKVVDTEDPFLYSPESYFCRVTVLLSIIRPANIQLYY